MSTTFGNRVCLDPDALRKHCTDHDLPTDWWGKANVYACPLGRGPGSGRILMSKGELDALDLTKDHDLLFFDGQNDSRKYKRITLLQGVCVLPNLRGDPTAPFLCDLVDRRWHLARIPINRAYNFATDDGEDYREESLDAGDPWTWDTLVQDLYDTLGITDDATLPFVPDGDPENFVFFGWMAWNALHLVFERIGCVLKYDGFKDTFSILKAGDTAAADATAADKELAKLDRDAMKMWDEYHVEPDRGRLPESVRVLFPRRPEPTDGSSIYYAVDVELPEDAADGGVEAGTYEVLHDDLTAVGSDDEPDNLAALESRADARAEAWRQERVVPQRTLVYRDFQNGPKLLSEALGNVLFDGRGGPIRTEVSHRMRPMSGPLSLPRFGAANKSYHVKLTASGTGIDGGTAWAGIIQHEVGGEVIDNGYIGANPDSATYCMYASDAEDGTDGNPEAGDIVIAIPDPSKPGVWIFRPKRGTGGDECGECGWISDLPIWSCLYIYMRGGYGRCGCIGVDCFNCEQDPELPCKPTVMVYDAVIGSWIGTEMKNTCCGCGAAIFDITSADDEEATLTFSAMHVSCEETSGAQSLFTLFLKKACCGVNRCGNRYMLFRGKGVDACDGDVAECGNEFYVMVECAPCPGIDCSCCCLEESPLAWKQNFPSGTFVGGGNEELNGYYIWTKNNTDPDRPCLWEAVCAPTGTTSTIEKIGTDVVLNHNGFIYKIPIEEWSCSSQNTLTYDSGGSGTHPATVTIEPMLPLDRDTGEPNPLACSPEDTLTVNIVSADCAIYNITQTITRTAPGSNTWAWTNPAVMGDRVGALSLICQNGEWIFTAGAICETGGPAPFGMATTTRADVVEFSPFELVWDSVDISGLDPSPTPDCCNVGTAIVTITE